MALDLPMLFQMEKSWLRSSPIGRSWIRERKSPAKSGWTYVLTPDSVRLAQRQAEHSVVALLRASFSWPSVVTLGEW